jgi:hypothetical protein
MNRRSFLLNGLLCTLAACVPSFPVTKATLGEAETVDIDWLRMASLMGKPFTQAEMRYRVNSGDWKKELFPVENRRDGVCIVKMFSNVELRMQTRNFAEQAG